MKTGILKKMLAVVLMALAVGLLPPNTASAKEEEIMLGPEECWFQAAKGGPIVYQVTSVKGKIEYLNTTTWSYWDGDGEKVTEGAEVKVDGRKITIIISDSSSEAYHSHFKIGNKKYYIRTWIGENFDIAGKKKITKKDFTFPVKQKWDGKSYNNICDILKAGKKEVLGSNANTVYGWCPEFSKKEIEGIKKTCRGIVVEKTITDAKLRRLYPSKEEDNTANGLNLYGIYKDEKAKKGGIWWTVARYYDKESETCVSKHIYISYNKNFNKGIVKAIAYMAYDPYAENWIYEI